MYFAAVFIINGCAYFPPKPAECNGPYQPINTGMDKNAMLTDQWQKIMSVKGEADVSEG